MVETIDEALDRLDLGGDSRYRPRYGHCREIAVALYDVFGGQLVALSQVPGVKQLDHAVVRIGDRTYDGVGPTPLPVLLAQYVPDAEEPLDAYTSEVTRGEVWAHRNFDESVYNEVHMRLTEMVDQSADCVAEQ